MFHGTDAFSLVAFVNGSVNSLQLERRIQEQSCSPSNLHFSFKQEDIKRIALGLFRKQSQ